MVRATWLVRLETSLVGSFGPDPQVCCLTDQGGEKNSAGHMTTCEIASSTPQLKAVSALAAGHTWSPHVPTFRDPMGSGDQGQALTTNCLVGLSSSSSSNVWSKPQMVCVFGQPMSPHAIECPGHFVRQQSGPFLVTAKGRTCGLASNLTGSFVDRVWTVLIPQAWPVKDFLMVCCG